MRRKGLHGLHGARSHLASTKKAPGPPDGIANEVLRFCNDEIASPLADIARTYFEVGYRPKNFRRTVTVALRKEEKPDYSVPGSYRRLETLETTTPRHRMLCITSAPHHAIQSPLTRMQLHSTLGKATHLFYESVIKAQVSDIREFHDHQRQQASIPSSHTEHDSMRQLPSLTPQTIV
jgi:hypothetical protein